jgi:hypothetical protein
MNCWRHFSKEIEVLEPALIWLHDADAQSSFQQAVRKDGLLARVLYEQLPECQQVNWAIFPREDRPSCDWAAIFELIAWKCRISWCSKVKLVKRSCNARSVNFVIEIFEVNSH